MEQINQSDTGRVFTPSGWRMLLTRDILEVLPIFLLWLTSIGVGKIFHLQPVLIDTIVHSWIYIVIYLLGYAVMYGLNHKKYSIKIDANVITGATYAGGSKRILRTDICPDRSSHRKIFGGLFSIWYIRDIFGNAITISDEDFQPGQIEEILKTLGIKINDSKPEHVFKPSFWRKILIRTALFGAVIFIMLILSLALEINSGQSTRIPLVSDFSLIIVVAWWFILFSIYGLDREMYWIKIDAFSITGPHRIDIKLIPLKDIDPVRSRRRNIIDKLINGWHIRDARGKGLFISGLDFRADEIAEILRCIGLEKA
jgi:hypothetical protein